MASKMVNTVGKSAAKMVGAKVSSKVKTHTGHKPTEESMLRELIRGSVMGVAAALAWQYTVSWPNQAKREAFFRKEKERLEKRMAEEEAADMADIERRRKKYEESGGDDDEEDDDE